MSEESERLIELVDESKPSFVTWMDWLSSSKRANLMNETVCAYHLAKHEVFVKAISDVPKNRTGIH